jgi:hypothetical protein
MKLHYQWISKNSSVPLYDREPGAACVLNEDCNCRSAIMHNSSFYLTNSVGGINCNQTNSYTYPGVCGGFGAYMNNSEVYNGLDFGRDYCLSGESRGCRGRNAQ